MPLPMKSGKVDGAKYETKALESPDFFPSQSEPLNRLEIGVVNQSRISEDGSVNRAKETPITSYFCERKWSSHNFKTSGLSKRSLASRSTSNNNINHLQLWRFPTDNEILGLLHEEIPKGRFDKFIDIFDQMDLSHYQVPGARSIWSALCDVMTTFVLYGFEIDYVQSLLTIQINFLEWVFIAFSADPSLESWLKVAKYRLGCFASQAKDSSMEVPNPFSVKGSDLPLQSPKLRKFLFKLKKYDYPTYMSLVDSICRGVKKGCDRPDFKACCESLPKTFKKFTTPKPIPMVTVKDIAITRELVEQQISRTVIETIKVKKGGRKEFKWKHFPSTSACIENNVQDGGQVPVIADILYDNFGSIDSRVYIRPKTVLFCDPHLEDKGIVGDPFCRDPIFSDLSYVERSNISKIPLHRWREILEVDFFCDPGSFTQEEIDILFDICLSGEREIILVALSEALKIRGISKGVALESWLLKPIQKYLTKLLGRFEVFKPTIGTLTEEMINNMFNHLGKDIKVLSGDYSDATNEMIVSFTKHTISEILQRLGYGENSRLHRLAVRSLCQNKVSYAYKLEPGKHAKVYKDSGEQCEAQPMGKVLSFVTLCLINFTVCRMSCEIDQEIRIPIRKFVGFINGDDCCFPLKDFSIWERIASVPGLDNSVGKTFHSERFIEMNSRTFLRLEQGNFVIVPFVNFGLLKGLKRSAETKAIVKKHYENDKKTLERIANLPLLKLSNLGAMHKDLVDGNDFLYHPLTDLFIRNNAETLKHRHVDGIPWFLPCWLGGVGLIPSPDLKNLLSFDRKKAGIIYANFNELKPRKIVAPADWKIYSIAQKVKQSILSNYGISIDRDVQNNEYDDFYENLIDRDGRVIQSVSNEQKLDAAIINLIWRNAHFDCIFDDPATKSITGTDISSVLKTLYHNKRMFGKVSRFLEVHRSHTDKLEYYKIWHQKQMRQFPIIIKEQNTGKLEITSMEVPYDLMDSIRKISLGESNVQLSNPDHKRVTSLW